MKEDRNEETFFYELMSKSKLNVPFSDFDDNVMRMVELHNQRRRSIQRDMRLSWIFFLTGSVFGILISAIMSNFKSSIFGIEPERLLLPFQIVFVFLLVAQVNNICEFYKQKKIRIFQPRMHERRNE